MKNEQKFEKQLVSFDETEFKRQIGDFEKNRDLLNQIAEHYEGLFTGKITHERIGQVFAGNYTALKAAAQQAIKKEVKHQSLAEVAIQRTNERLEDFETEVTRLVYRFNQSVRRLAFSTITPLDWFEINSCGRFNVPEETINKIRESCSNFISTMEEQELHEALNQVATGYTRFLAGWGQVTREHLSIYSPIENFLLQENGVFTARPDIDYSQLAH